MVTQVDYVIAVGIFIISFGFVIGVVTDYFSNLQESTDINSLRSEGYYLMDALFEPPSPANWSTAPDKIGISTKAYVMEIVLNNTGPPIVNHRVDINFTELGYGGIDFNSTRIYVDNNKAGYHRDNDRVFFAINLSAGQKKTVKVYFDDDSNFTSLSRSSSLQPLRYDFGPGNLKRGFTSANRTDLYPDYGWESAADSEKDTHGDYLERDVIYDNETNSFAVDVPNNVYNVTVYLGDNSAQHKNITLSANGVAKVSNQTISNQVAGFSYTVNVTGGILNQTISVLDQENETWSWAGFTMSPVNLSQIKLPVKGMDMFQYKQLIALNGSQYSDIRGVATDRHFHINLFDINSNLDMLNFSSGLNSTIPAQGDVIALQRYTMYQNLTDIKNGSVIVYVW